MSKQKAEEALRHLEVLDLRIHIPIKGERQDHLLNGDASDDSLLSDR